MGPLGGGEGGPVCARDGARGRPPCVRSLLHAAPQVHGLLLPDTRWNQGWRRVASPDSTGCQAEEVHVLAAPRGEVNERMAGARARHPERKRAHLPPPQAGPWLGAASLTRDLKSGVEGKR